MRDVLTAHAVDRSRRARPERIGIAARMLGGHSNGPIGAAQHGSLIIKGIGVAKIKDEAGVLGETGEGDGGASFDAEGFRAQRHKTIEPWISIPGFLHVF